MTDILDNWDASPTALTVTNLASLPDGAIWQTGELTKADPVPQLVRVSYKIVFNATPVAGDSLDWYFASNDGDASSEIWDGGIGTAEGQITTAAAKAAVDAACALVKRHAWQTSHGTTFQGSFDLFLPGPSYQVLCKANGEALASSGHTVRIAYHTPST